MAGNIQIRTFMSNHAEDFRDDCGEINMTGLAEAACAEFDDYGKAPQYDIPETYFECAYEISSRDKAHRNHTVGSAAAGAINARGSDWF
jgi:hypothetical protein